MRGGGAWLACLGELWVALVGEGEPPRKANARKLNARDEGCAFNLCVFVHLRNIGCRTPELVDPKLSGVKTQNVAHRMARRRHSLGHRTV